MATHSLNPPQTCKRCLALAHCTAFHCFSHHSQGIVVPSSSVVVDASVVPINLTIRGMHIALLMVLLGYCYASRVRKCGNAGGALSCVYLASRRMRRLWSRARGCKLGAGADMLGLMAYRCAHRRQARAGGVWACMQRPCSPKCIQLQGWGGEG
eukprot:6539342-Pyramimonas_sp.AAC.1